MINIKSLLFVFTFSACFFVTKDSNAQEINRFDKNKKRTGIWKKYYPNKRIRYSGEFKNGKEVGVFNFYDITNSDHPVVVKTFFENSDSLFVQFYTLAGKIETEGVIRGKKREGNWKYYYPSGELLSEENYKDGLLDGEQLVYYLNGQVTEFSNYKNGLLDGQISKFASNGNLIEEVNYTNGKLNGLAKYFELNGNLKESGNYRDGKKEGKWDYYVDGKIVTEEVKKGEIGFTKKKEN